MTAYFPPEFAHFAAGFDAFEDKDRIAVHMFQAFLKQPAIVRFPERYISDRMHMKSDTKWTGPWKGRTEGCVLI